MTKFEFTWQGVKMARREEELPRAGNGAILYAAYGSNLHLGQMARRCPTAVHFAHGTLPGHKLRFRGMNGSAVATVEPSSNSQVPVKIWAIQQGDLESLDRYEGWPTLYRRETMRFRLDGGGEVRALVYIMNPGRKLGAPSLGYFRTIQQGYATAGFALDKLIRAAMRSIPTEQK